ncbi:tagaturonate reductase [Dyadobacter tibetensis]|uniref:tagaturonate reductase n=1 Tax=Dyadobacter tibetensis TaxID=1211851 RepID=UPI00046F2C1D|nr:tagaturonate reductase [Dyadobacter tibetensis]
MKNLSKEFCPQREIFDFPEKALFFGTGVLLRGLPLYFIDKANKNGVFKGRVVVVKSTDKGDISAYARQDNCFTTVVRGEEKGKSIMENEVNYAISRVLTAADEWSDILEFARSPNLNLVVSNTTEVGITYVDEDFMAGPPSSFPGKLLAVLYERYQAFKGDPAKGLGIVPTELVSENGDQLRHILLRHVERNGLETGFRHWLLTANHFCNSLVDRIVPGEIKGALKDKLEAELGYQDDLMIMAEPYRLWAIEGDAQVKELLSFAQIDEGVKVVPSIADYKELKLRLLNAPHTFCCGVAYLSGHSSVKAAMKDSNFVHFMEGIMSQEIALCLPKHIEKEQIKAFSETVLDRFRNEFLDHQWLSISTNYTTKMKMRCVGLIENWYQNSAEVPHYMAFAFAAYIRFMKAVDRQGNGFQGEASQGCYTINDSEASLLASIWADASLNMSAKVQVILSQIGLWGSDLSSLPGFAKTVERYLEHMLADRPITLKAWKNIVA